MHRYRLLGSTFESITLTALLLLASVASGVVHAAEDSVSESSDVAETPDGEVLAGHSYHGEAFNEGPRQAAVLIENMGNVAFPNSAKDEQAARFFQQGVAALHGFWYLEAERSFRQAVKLEPDLAIAYWGMAMANLNNEERAKGMIDKAVEKRDMASEHERLYIDALSKYLSDVGQEADKEVSDDKKKEQRKNRELRFIKDLEKILNSYPDDIEAKAFLALRLWESSRFDIPITSHYAVNSLLQQVFDANPNHPAHHYRIHLWDNERPETALASAAMCGPAIPAIAHMWHMPGHIYSKLHRYSDAAWQQEASARTDHAHMIRTRLMPDQIHNFAHNNEWLTRNLIYLGRVSDALVQAKNLVAMPQHPKYNSITERGSYRYGRTRLLQTLTEFELWGQLLEEANGSYLTPTDDAGWQAERLAWMSVAHTWLDQAIEAKKIDWELRERILKIEAQQIELEKEKEGVKEPVAEEEEQEQEQEDGKDKVKEQDFDRDLSRLTADIKELRRYLALQRAAMAAKRGEPKKLNELLEEAGRVDDTLAANWLAAAGDRTAAIEELKKVVERSPGQVRPRAALAKVYWQDGQQEQAVAVFEELRKVASEAELTTPMLAGLADIATHLQIEGDWRIAAQPADDLGQRPELDTLGPARWSPYQAPSFNAIDAQGNPITDDAYQGRARLVIYYLGFGCLHCVEQLDTFKPMVNQFAEAGIEIVGISTESSEDFLKGMTRYDDQVPFTLLADPSNESFHNYRCWDDFENQPLHGTFLIDPLGRVRWQDIGYEPFTDAEFLLRESKRLLSLPND